MRTIRITLYGEGSVSTVTVVGEGTYRALESIVESLNDKREEKWEPSIALEDLTD